LPVVTTFSLTRGALRLAKQKVVVKRLSAIEDLGGIEILCTDKTGTLTQNVLTIAEIAPGALKRTQLYSGGSEAVEAAIRLAKAYTKKFEVVGFWGGFHGKTGGVMGLIGDEWKQKRKERIELSPLDSMEDDDLEKLRNELADYIGRTPSEEEFILFLMHPKDALNMIEFREKYGETPLVLPTDVWRSGLKKPGDKVDFELLGKPYSIELVSVGAEHEGLVHVVMRVNNKTRVYTVETPRAKKVEIRIAKALNEIGAPINGDRVYRGAIDNATGVGGVLPSHSPKRARWS